jgi:hypothetical protein
MTFWRLDNIDLWLLAGVIFNVLWAIIKAIDHDYEKHEERIREIEYKLSKIKKKQ